MEEEQLMVLTFKVRLKQFISQFKIDKQVLNILKSKNKSVNTKNYNNTYNEVHNKITKVIHHNTKFQNYEFMLIKRSIRKLMKLNYRIASDCIRRKTETLSSKSYGDTRLPSTIINATIRKYKGSKTSKNVNRNVNLIVNMNGETQAIKHQNNILTITPLKLFERWGNASQKIKDLFNDNENIDLRWSKIVGKPLQLLWKSPVKYEKINQVEINDKYCYINLSVRKEHKITRREKTFGVDLNLKPSLVSITDLNRSPESIQFLGRGILNIREKYQQMRKRYQKQNKEIKPKFERRNKAKTLNTNNKTRRIHKEERDKIQNEIDKRMRKINKIKVDKKKIKYLRQVRKLKNKQKTKKKIFKVIGKQQRTGRVNKMGNKERRVMENLNHKVSSTISKLDGNISFERLQGIRQCKTGRKTKNWLQTWSFYSLQQKTEYKSVRKGKIVMYVSPYNSSKECSRCYKINNCNGKLYKCNYCGIKLHRDVNSPPNLAARCESILNILM